jgi:hypothetical protein
MKKVIYSVLLLLSGFAFGQSGAMDLTKCPVHHGGTSTQAKNPHMNMQLEMEEPGQGHGTIVWI